MGRIKVELLTRVEAFSDRIVDVVEVLEKHGRSRRIIDQITGSGTSVGANMFEADEALSRADFCKTIGIVLKELNETRFWIRMISRRKWLPAARLGPLQAESDELRRILGTILTRSRQRPD